MVDAAAAALEPTALANEFLAPDRWPDPAPLYADLHRAGTIHRTDFAWLVTGYDACISALREPRFSSVLLDIDVQDADGNSSVAAQLARDLIINQDPPVHTRIRSIVNRAFTPRAAEQKKDMLLKLSAEVIDAAIERAEGATEPVDFINEIAQPLPSYALCEILGVPRADRVTFYNWADQIVAFVEGIALTDDKRAAAETAAQEFTAYTEALIDERKARPRDDLLSEMIRAEEDGDRLSHQELVALIMALIIAGNETTTSVLGSAILGLKDRPDARALVAGDPTILPAAVAEFLRHDGPVRAAARTTTEDMEFEGAHLRKGEFVMVAVGAANHDPTRFPDPTTLDFTRENLPGIAFGYGIHYCVGAALARTQLEIALPYLYQRLPNLQPVEVSYKSRFLVRGHERMTVTW